MLFINLGKVRKTTSDQDGKTGNIYQVYYHTPLKLTHIHAIYSILDKQQLDLLYLLQYFYRNQSVDSQYI